MCTARERAANVIDSPRSAYDERSDVKAITPFIDLKTQYAALRESIDARMRAVLEHGQFILGPEVVELEERLAAYTDARHCVSCASGTEALLIALLALDIKSGDEVI